MDLQLAQSFRYCQGVARRRARNFYYAFRVMPPERQRAICAIYAFMRYCDDISDEPGSPISKQAMMDRWQNALAEALRGNFGENRIMPAFHDTVRRFAIPEDYFHSLIEGARMDLEVNRYTTFAELYTYCYRVASVVGLVCVHIFGFQNAEAITHAEHVGIAFQLTNILRDINEDAGMGRIYLPREDLESYRYPETDLLAGIYDDRFRELMRFEVSRARSFYRSAPLLVPMVEPISRGGLAAMINIYQAILNKIEDRSFDIFSNRVELSLHEKVRLAGQGWLNSYLPGGREQSRVS